jgi:hypothetical protein
MKILNEHQVRRNCSTCLYRACDEDTAEKEKCLRFARFVDHLINENSRDCDYWQPAQGS